MPGLGTKSRRLTPAQHDVETGLRRKASIFVAACEIFSGATHALQSKLKLHDNQLVQPSMSHF
jgi:hypothetical protein